MDLDYAIYELIKYKYNKKPEVFNQIYMQSNDEMFIKTLLYDRYELNPLCVFLTDEYKEDADSLYEQIMKTEYETILSIIKNNDIFRLMETYAMTPDVIDITVLCADEAQVNIIKGLDNTKKLNPIIGSRQTMNLSKYDAIWLSKYAQILQYKNVAGKYIYIHRAKYNFEKGKPPETIKYIADDIILSSNRILLVNPYTWLELPIDNIIEEDNYDGEV